MLSRFSAKSNGAQESSIELSGHFEFAPCSPYPSLLLSGEVWSAEPSLNCTMQLVLYVGIQIPEMWYRSSASACMVASSGDLKQRKLWDIRSITSVPDGDVPRCTVSEWPSAGAAALVPAGPSFLALHTSPIS